MKIFGREPTLWLSVIAGIITLLATLGFHLLTKQEGVLIIAAIYAVFGAINAFAVRPVSPAAFTYAVGALVAVAAGYGFNLAPDQVAAVDFLIVPILALLTRNQVSPQDTPVSAA